MHNSAHQLNLNLPRCNLAASRATQGTRVKTLLKRLLRNESGQDIAEYAIMLAVILIIVVGTVKLIGTNANNTFSSVASTLGQ